MSNTAIALEAQAYQQRANYYRLLARLLYEELTDELMKELASSLEVMPLDDDLPELERMLSIGNNKMAKYIQRATADTKTETRCDYARIFLGAGSVSKIPVSPFESVYTSADRLLMQESRDAVCKLYAAEKIAIQDSYNMPEDHIAFLFQFMAYLLDKQAAFLAEGNEAATLDAEESCRSFVENHLANWVTRFVEEAMPKAHTGFYQGLLQCTDAWVKLECEGYGLDIDAIVAAAIEAVREAQRKQRAA